MISFITSLGISILIIPVIILIARKFDIMDKPDRRKKHKKPTPLLGGLAIFISFTLTVLINKNFTMDIQRLIIYSGIIVIMGTIDDIKDIKPIYKLSIEVICAVLIFSSGIRLHIGDYIGLDRLWSYPLDILITVAWIVGITNAINITDGLDGLAGGIALIASIAFAKIFMLYHFVLLNQLSLILSGAILGFIIYNFYPAKLFMGDGGSLFLGFLLSVFSIMYINADRSLTSIWVPIVILSVPIFEIGSSILRRAFKRHNLMKADDGHIHHILLKKGFGPAVVVSLIYTVAILSGALGILIIWGNFVILAIFIVICLIAIGIRLYI